MFTDHSCYDIRLRFFLWSSPCLTCLIVPCEPEMIQKIIGANVGHIFFPCRSSKGPLSCLRTKLGIEQRVFSDLHQWLTWFSSRPLSSPSSKYQVLPSTQVYWLIRQDQRGNPFLKLSSFSGQMFPYSQWLVNWGPHPASFRSPRVKCNSWGRGLVW